MKRIISRIINIDFWDENFCEFVALGVILVTAMSIIRIAIVK